jgi:hypothetical protein
MQAARNILLRRRPVKNMAKIANMMILFDKTYTLRISAERTFARRARIGAGASLSDGSTRDWASHDLPRELTAGGDD